MIGSTENCDGARLINIEPQLGANFTAEHGATANARRRIATYHDGRDPAVQAINRHFTGIGTALTVAGGNDITGAVAFGQADIVGVFVGSQVRTYLGEATHAVRVFKHLVEVCVGYCRPGKSQRPVIVGGRNHWRGWCARGCATTPAITAAVPGITAVSDIIATDLLAGIFLNQVIII